MTAVGTKTRPPELMSTFKEKGKQEMIKERNMERVKCSPAQMYIKERNSFKAFLSTLIVSP